jgi:hypothetical protein
MAISPNTDFTTGQVLTATNANQWPRGVVAYATRTSNLAFSTTETTMITASTFTAVANRYYKITYYEPAPAWIAGAGNYIFGRIRLTNTSGTQYTQSVNQASGGTAGTTTLITQVITTFSAGSTVIIGTLQSNTSTPTAFCGATQPAFILVEDLGPA